MSDLMLHGVLKMPIDLWNDSDLDKMQRHSRYIQASDLIKEQSAEIERLSIRRRVPVAKYNALQEECDGRMAAIKTMQQRIDELERKMDTQYWDAVHTENVKLRKRIEELEQQWIPVSERLPEKGGRYLAYYPNIYGWEIDTFDGELWGTECDGYKVTHWMPLPEPPENNDE